MTDNICAASPVSGTAAMAVLPTIPEVTSGTPNQTPSTVIIMKSIKPQINI